MPRGLDHITHTVRDLDALAAVYERVGFIVGGRNRHSWGTHNRIVQLADFYVELLAVEEPEKIVPHAPRKFSFGGFNRDFVARNEGPAMLVLAGRNVAGDAEEFRAAGIGDFEPFPFERVGYRPDGTPVKVAFTLTFATDPNAPDIGFFTCHHRYPENFWNPAFQNHPNTAERIAGVVLVAGNPSDHHIFLSAFAGERELHATSTGITVKTPRGDIQVMDPTAFRSHFAESAPDVSGGARLAAIRFAVRDLSVAAGALARGKVSATRHMGRLIVGPTAARGATLVFEAAGSR